MAGGKRCPAGMLPNALMLFCVGLLPALRPRIKHHLATRPPANRLLLLLWPLRLQARVRSRSRGGRRPAGARHHPAGICVGGCVSAGKPTPGLPVVCLVVYERSWRSCLVLQVSSAELASRPWPAFVPRSWATLAVLSSPGSASPSSTSSATRQAPARACACALHLHLHLRLPAATNAALCCWCHA